MKLLLILLYSTHFYISDNTSDIKGKSVAEKHMFINSLFIYFDSFQDFTYISKLRKFFVYFESMDSLKHALTKTQEIQHNPIFTIINPTVK
jgi:hypothetical protein